MEGGLEGGSKSKRGGSTSSSRGRLFNHMKPDMKEPLLIEEALIVHISDLLVFGG